MLLTILDRRLEADVSQAKAINKVFIALFPSFRSQKKSFISKQKIIVFFF